MKVVIKQEPQWTLKDPNGNKSSRFYDFLCNKMLNGMAVLNYTS